MSAWSLRRQMARTEIQSQRNGTSRLNGPPSINPIMSLVVLTGRYPQSAGTMERHRFLSSLSRPHGGCLVGGDPSSTLPICANFLPSNGLHQITDSQPQHTNRSRIARCDRIIDGQFDFVGFVDRDLEVFQPPIVSGWVRDRPLVAFNLDDDSGFVVDLGRFSRKSSMVQVSS
jgi:hypothetical protein